MLENKTLSTYEDQEIEIVIIESLTQNNDQIITTTTEPLFNIYNMHNGIIEVEIEL